MKPLLALVDLQADFLESPGLEPAAPEIVRRAQRLLCFARARGIPVVHVRTTVDPDADDRMPHWKALGVRRCVRGTDGHAAPPELAEAPGERIASKTFFSAFTAPGLDEAIVDSGADALLLSGVHLHGCVRATALDAYARGLAVWIADDAVGSDDPLHAAVTRRYLETRAARFLRVEEILRRLGDGSAVPADGIARLPRAIVAGARIDADGERSVLVHRAPREAGRGLFAVPVSGAGEAARAAAAAREAAGPWRRRATADRRERVEALAAVLRENATALAREIAIDVGKPIAQAGAEVARAADLARAAARLEIEVDAARNSDSAYRRVPVGVVAAITPWNNPVAIAIGKIAPALVLGNAVVWKPAPAAARVAVRLLDLLRDAGVPDGLVNVVAGDEETARAVMEADGIDAITLSGSSLAGWAAQEAAARRRIPLQAELGGNNAAIVWEGADLDAAARLVARGAFAFAGQRCTANRRAIVDRRLFADFVARVAAAAAELSWGDPLDAETDVGPLISVDARDRVAAAVDRARPIAEAVLAPHGAGMERRAPYAAGAYYPPTVVVAPPAGGEIVQEESFGPILVVQPAADFDEALRLVDDVRQGLVAALFSGPGERGRFLGAVRAGIVKWNASTADADADAPFGGWKSSGLGPPEHGPGDLEFHTRLQALYGLHDLDDLYDLYDGA